jgi:5-methylcytosine-specific restriction endonuclease McrA
MTTSLLVLLVILVIVVLIVGFISAQGRGRGSSRSGSSEHTTRRRNYNVRKRTDHGARIAQLHGVARSPQWSRVEKEHLLREPTCMACGTRKNLQVHHVKPFHLHPKLELDPNNLITLCEAKGKDHHLLLGHLDEWKSYNSNVREDVKRFYHKSAAQIRADIHWQKMVQQRPD